MTREACARWNRLLSRLGIVVLFLVGTVLAHANNVAVLVGCNGNGLQFADDDARLIATTLIQFAGYHKDDVRILTSQPKPGEQEATATNISKAIMEMAHRQADAPQSTFLFFASTHGVETKEQGAMLAAKNYNPKQPLAGAQAELTAGKLTQRLAALKSGLVVALFDICRKDGLLRAEREKQNGFVLPSGQAGKVATLFSSSEGPSFECADVKQAAHGHGYFTYYVCQGLSARNSDKGTLPIVGGLDETAGGVTVKSLHEYVRWNLLEQTRNLSGAEKVREELSTQAGRRGEATVAVSASSGLGGQLPELKCEAVAEQGMLAPYAKGTCQAEISPDNEYAALRNKGLNWYEKQKYERAAGYFEDAFGVKREAWVAFAAGVCYAEAGKLKEAEEQWRNALAANPKYAKAMFNLGLLLNDQGKLKEAEEQWRNALAADPKLAEAMFNLGALLNDQGKLKEAEEQYRNALAADPKLAKAMTNLGVLLNDQGKLKEAEEQYRNAIATDPKYATAMNNLGALLKAQGKLKEAEEQYRNALAANPKYATAMTNLGVLLKAQGKLKEAEQQYRNALAAAPKHVKAMYNLGNLLKAQGKLKEAEEQYRNAIHITPDNGLYHANLAMLLFDMNRKEEALMEAKTAQRLGVKQHPVFEKLGLKMP